MEIGHNGGPPLKDEDRGATYRLFLWKKAKRELKKIPVEIVRFRMKDAEKEGLTYDEYCVKYRLHKELSSI
jgi:hypothetical protein|tara:strand:- start:99 stop:311 length:213 start_codon:yes stop_codon:yes gene_type:complete